MVGDQTLLGDNTDPAVAYSDSQVHLPGMSTRFKCSLYIKNQSLASLKIHLKLPYLLQKTVHDGFCLILITLLLPIENCHVFNSVNMYLLI